MRFHWSSEINGYGQAFRFLLGFPKTFPLFFTSDHGVDLANHHSLDETLRIQRKIPHLSWNSASLFANGELNSRKVVFIPNPWALYRIKKNISPNPERIGSVFFPIHLSGGHFTQGLDDANSITFLQELPAKYHPVTVCFYYGDMDSGRPEKFQKAGFKVFTLGSPRDYSFCANFYSKIRNFEFAFSEGWGSQIAYCVDLGIPTMMIDRPVSVRRSGDGVEVVGNEDPVYKMNYGKLKRIFNDFPDEITMKQRDFISNLLGYQYLENFRSVVWKLRIKWPLHAFQWFCASLLPQIIKFLISIGNTRA